MSKADPADPGTGSVLLPVPCCMALCHDLPRAADLDAAMRIVESVRLHLLGDGLLTVNRIAGAAAQNEVGGADLEDVVELQRIWTSNPLAYPLAGRKRKSMTPWTRQLLHRAEVFVGEGDVALAQAFNDHALISSLGLRAVVNVPLLDDRGQCFATFNALGIRARWQPEEIWLIRLLAALATPAVAKGAADAMT